MPQAATLLILFGKFDVSEYDIIRELDRQKIRNLKAGGGTRKQEEDQ